MSYIKPVLHAILAPIVINPLGLSEIEGEWSAKAKVERLAKIVRNDLEEAATDYEAMLYLHSQSFVAVLTERWLHVYFWLFWQFYPDQAKEFLDPVELHHLEEEELNRLKRWIYKKQKEALKERRKVRSTPHPPPPHRAKLGKQPSSSPLGGLDVRLSTAEMEAESEGYSHHRHATPRGPAADDR